MIPYARQAICEDDIKSVVKVLRSDWLTQGPLVPRFEECITSSVNARYAIAVNSATSALHLACKAIGVGLGDEVWTSPNSFVASANCALYCGAKVDFVDIDSRTYNLDVDKLHDKLKYAKSKKRLPKAVIAVHFAGQPCDIEGIYELSKIFGFRVIEDASHALGATYSKQVDNPLSVTRKKLRETDEGSSINVGSCKHSDITIFSFHPVKIITTGEGGLALTNRSDLAEKMALLRSHGITNNHMRMRRRPSQEIWNYQQIDLGFNYRMTELQAALGLSQMKKLNKFILKRRVIAKRYDEQLSEMPITLPWQNPQSASSFHLYPIRVNYRSCGITQQDLYRYMHQNEVSVNVHYIPIHRHPYFERLGFKRGDFPEAERFHREMLSLPIFPTLRRSDQDRVIKLLRKVITK